MDTDSSTPRNPRLRGLDPELLLGVLENDVLESLPQIPGWHISGVAGQGGSGIVWRAERLADGAVAAIKIAPPDEPETVERIEREAGFLRELRHPHIVGLLETGPLVEGSDAGGLYMAMEFIDGPALAHEIPEHGLPPEQAFRWFREIASAVAHAHDSGILHRDLKPGNAIITPDGHIKVADFGLARPVHRRVHMLSLTRAGLVAGTAEYLPPEAYRSDYRPGPEADIFALGVMLHEMLTGTPPRGAWQPASYREGVDVRIDEIIRRAMHPDPALRWPDARAMVAALDAVIASPPRYAGTPLVNFPIRVTDCLWTLLGLFMFMAGTSSLMNLDKAWVKLPFDLIGDHGRLIGAFHALFILTLLAIPLGGWQIARLRRFRHIPMREALPSPFGLRLGHCRTAAVLVLLCQVLCLLMPVIHMLNLYIQSSLTWLHSGDPPWAHGLAVTTFEERTPLSPWKFPHAGKFYWLWESDGPPDNPLSNTIERIGFFPFYIPLLMLSGGLLAAGALWITAITACRLWWCRSRPCLAVLSVIPLLGLSVVLVNAHSQQSGYARELRRPDREDWIVNAHMTRHLTAFAGRLLGGRPGEPVFGPDGGCLFYYAETLNYRSHGMISREKIPDLYAAGLTPARDVRIQVLDHVVTWNPADSYFDLRVKALEFFDGLAHGGGSGVTRIDLVFNGTVTIGGHTSIHTEQLTRQPLWLTSERVIAASEAAAWARALQDAADLAASDPQAADSALARLFHPFSVEADDYKLPGQWHLRGTDHAGSLACMLQDGALRLQPAGTVVEETLPGGRSRIAIPVQAGIPRRLRAELVHESGNWRCVRLAF